MIRWTMVTPGNDRQRRHLLRRHGQQRRRGRVRDAQLLRRATPPGSRPSNPGEHTKYLTYPQTHTLSSSQASYDAKTGVITMHIPLSDVGNPPDGTVLYSATAFSATSTAPQSSTTLFNLTDATTPFELVIGSPGTVGATPTGPPPLSSKNFSDSRPGARRPRAS